MTTRAHALERELREILTSREYHAFVRGLEAVVTTLNILQERAPKAARRLVIGRLQPLEQMDLPEDARTGLEQFLEALIASGDALPPLHKKQPAKVTTLRPALVEKREKRQ